MWLLLCFSCRHENESTIPAHDPDRPIKLTTFSPDSGRIQEQVLLEGENFGNDPGIVKVYFNKKQAKVVGAAGDMIYVIVPRMPGDTCRVAVVVGRDSAVYGSDFIYRLTANVSTVAGNGASVLKLSKNLNECSFPSVARVTFDEKRGDLLFLTGTEGEYNGALVRINEDKNIAEAIYQSGVNNGIYSDPVWVGSKLYFVSRRRDYVLNIVDTDNGYQRREVIMTRNKDQTNWASGNQWAGALAFRETDSCLYFVNRNQLIRAPLKTLVMEIIANLPFQNAVTMAIHPVRKNLAFFWVNGGSANPPYFTLEEAEKFCGGIVMIDLNDPQNTIRKLNHNNNCGAMKADGFLATAIFSTGMGGINFDSEGNLYVADQHNHSLRKIILDLDNLDMSTVESILGTKAAGGFKDGPAKEAEIHHPHGVWVNRAGEVYFGDSSNNRLRRLAIE